VQLNKASRKSDTCMMLGLQGRSQIELRYGREAEAMLSQPRTSQWLETQPTAALRRVPLILLS